MNDATQGAFRDRNHSVFAYRPDRSKTEIINYDTCSKCRGVFQARYKLKPVMPGLGSSQGPTSLEGQRWQMEEKQRRDFRVALNDQVLRARFRESSQRCTCNPSADELIMANPEERDKRMSDVLLDRYPAGWYPNPVQGNGERYWNGTAWTDQFRGVLGNAVASGDEKLIPENVIEKVATRWRRVKKSFEADRDKADRASKISQLQQLHEQGVLTAEQFEAAKKKVLDGMS